MTVSRMEAKLDRIELRIPDRSSISLDQSSLSKGLKMVTLPLPTEFFTGRDEYLNTVEGCFEFPKSSIELGKQRRFVFHGTGGMGKTQLALKFLDRNKDRYASSYQLKDVFLIIRLGSQNDTGT